MKSKGVLYKAEGSFDLAAKPVSTIADARREAKMLSRCAHPHVLAFVALGSTERVSTASNSLCIVTMRCCSSMGDRMIAMSVDAVAHKEVLRLGLVRKWAVQVLDALAHMHELEIVHRDVKTANILSNSPGMECDMILADFGFACEFEQARGEKGTFGTDVYFPPETLTGHWQGPSADVWALGICVYRFVTFLMPKGGGKGLDPDKVVRATPAFKAGGVDVLAKRALTLVESERPTARQLVDDFGCHRKSDLYQVVPVFRPCDVPLPDRCDVPLPWESASTTWETPAWESDASAQWSTDDSAYTSTCTSGDSLGSRDGLRQLPPTPKPPATSVHAWGSTVAPPTSPTSPTSPKSPKSPKSPTSPTCAVPVRPVGSPPAWKRRSPKFMQTLQKMRGSSAAAILPSHATSE